MAEHVIRTLVLLRHGESEWNAKNQFTGWVDVGLSARGQAETRRGGELPGAARKAGSTGHTPSAVSVDPVRSVADCGISPVTR